MKLAVSLLALLPLLTLSACNTANTRRDLFAPKKGSGYWTTREHHGKAQADAALTRTTEPPLKPAAAR